MQAVFGLENLRPNWRGATVCIGVFDGVHLGHQKVIGTAIENAHSHSRPAVVLTFDKNPLAFLRPDKCPKSILSPTAKMRKVAEMGADVALVVSFDEKFSQQSADEFLRNVLMDGLHAEHIVVGHDFAFAKNRSGTPQWLAQQVSTEVIPPFEINGRRVSSTEIRRDIEEGKVSEAAELLGGNYALAGIVVQGQKLGRQLGIPTANLAPIFDQVIPKMGIYAGYATTLGERFPAAISVGMRPAIKDAGFAIEAHLLGNVGESLYGRELSLEFFVRLRDEMSFNSEDELVNQMKLDIEQTRRLV